LSNILHIHPFLAFILSIRAALPLTRERFYFVLHEQTDLAPFVCKLEASFMYLPGISSSK